MGALAVRRKEAKALSSRRKKPMKSLLRTTILLAAFAALSGVQAQETVIQIQADQVLHPVSRYLTGACIEDVNHEIYGGIYSQMIFGESFQEPAPSFQTGKAPQVSGMWRAMRRGTAVGRFAIVSEHPFVGGQSQQLSFDSGEGEWGVENQGLNRWGMNFVAGKPYEGYVWVRAEKPTTTVCGPGKPRRFADLRRGTAGRGRQRLAAA